MNLDFHFYGTYAAAKIVGFDDESAKEIAWAAQMVDEFTEGYAKKAGIKDPTVTCETTKDNFADDINMLSDPYNETLLKIRKIWVPFHFLPNVSYNDEYMLSSLNERDKPDYRCRCYPNSSLTKNLVNYLVGSGEQKTDIKQYSKAYESIYIYIGIVMHILADTWAHQGFAGSPNYMVNYIEGEQVFHQDYKEGIIDKTHNIGTNYEIMFLGHGIAGHKPDTGYLVYEYKEKASEKKIKVHNTERFFAAFAQMVEAMLDIVEGIEFVPVEYGYADIGNGKLDLLDAYKDEIENVLHTEAPDQSTAWLKLLQNRHLLSGSLVFDKDNIPEKNIKLQQFSEAAWDIQRLVVEEINAQVPRYFG